MSDEHGEFDPEMFEDVEIVDVQVVTDHYAGVKRAASIVGDLRAELRKEGFTREETFALVQAYWSAEMGLLE
ncbi:hypothetical protein ACIPX0_26240 [Streptomyces sp. NPDC090075]|uniref:DUF7187 family protein n=1 Tax=Streptomyces sp. NPDC090075 TaxID=3365937 RepID=UPI00381E5FC7